jgi:crossover junction endodeoxyribonuclease RusA
MSSFTLSLPWPDRRLSPNARIDRRAKAGAVSAARELAYLSALEVIGNCGPVALDGELQIKLMFYPPDKRRCDLDNMHGMCKAYQDGLCQALGIDDSRIVRAEMTRNRQRPGGLVIMTIEEAPCCGWG